MRGLENTASAQAARQVVNPTPLLFQPTKASLRREEPTFSETASGADASSNFHKLSMLKESVALRTVTQSRVLATLGGNLSDHELISRNQLRNLGRFHPSRDIPQIRGQIPCSSRNRFDPLALEARLVGLAPY